MGSIYIIKRKLTPEEKIEAVKSYMRGALLEVIQTETEVEMQPRNKAAMDEVEQ